MKSNFLTVKMPCKRVVKSYLEKNFGSPATIPEEHLLYKLACSQLFKENIRSNFYSDYPCEIEFNISEKNFKFDGFNLNDANIRNFNNAVSSHIKILCRSNLDSLLLLHDKQISWKNKYLSLMESTVKGGRSAQEITKMKRQLREELGDDEFTIKKAIEFVVTVILKLDLETLNYEAVKKDYYRYRNK